MFFGGFLGLEKLIRRRVFFPWARNSAETSSILSWGPMPFKAYSRHTHWYRYVSMFGCSTLSPSSLVDFRFIQLGTKVFSERHHRSMHWVPPILLKPFAVVATLFAYSWSWWETCLYCKPFLLHSPLHALFPSKKQHAWPLRASTLLSKAELRTCSRLSVGGLLPGTVT